MRSHSVKQELKKIGTNLNHQLFSVKVNLKFVLSIDQYLSTSFVLYQTNIDDSQIKHVDRGIHVCVPTISPKTTLNS